MENTKELETRKSIPAVCDIFHDKESVVLTLEMPGVSKENLDIKIDKDLLIIHGKRVINPVNGAYKIKEIRDCDFHQEYTIDDTINREKIDAVIKNGIVTLTLGIKESEKPRKIEVVAK
jgi:HSP20 family protein